MDLTTMLLVFCLLLPVILAAAIFLLGPFFAIYAYWAPNWVPRLRLPRWRLRAPHLPESPYNFDGALSPYATSSLAMLKYLQRKREEGFPFRHDQEILQELGIRLRDWNQRTRNSIASDCQFGRVVLQGTVTHIEHKEEVGLLATKTLGVLDVSNQVVVRAS